MLYHWTFALPAGQMAMVELAKQSTCHHTLSHVYKASEPFRARKTAANPVITGTSEVGLQLLISLTRHCCSMKYHCSVPSQARLAWLILVGSRCGDRQYSTNALRQLQLATKLVNNSTERE